MAKNRAAAAISSKASLCDAFLDPIAQFGYAFALGAVIAAEHATILLQSMTDDADAAMPARRRERVDRTLETVENMSLSSHHNLEGFVVLVAAALAFRHMCLLFAQ